MTLGERLKLVRGTTSQRAFAAEIGIHENTVSNAERRNSATQDYLQKLAGPQHQPALAAHRPRRDADGRGRCCPPRGKTNLALVDALRVAYGTRYSSVPLDTPARALRAGATYLRAIGVTEDTLPDTQALAKLLRLTIEVMRRT